MTIEPVPLQRHLHSYIAGDGHGIFEWWFYGMEVNGQGLVDRVTKLIEGESVGDMRWKSGVR